MLVILSACLSPMAASPGLHREHRHYYIVHAVVEVQDEARAVEDLLAADQ